MSKKLTKKRCREVILAALADVEPALCGPRPEGLPASVAWGITHTLESGAAAAGRPVAVVFTLRCVKPEQLTPRFTSAVSPPVAESTIKTMESLCRRLRDALGIPVRWNWTVGLRALSDGTDLAFYDRIAEGAKPAGYTRSAVS